MRGFAQMFYAVFFLSPRPPKNLTLFKNDLSLPEAFIKSFKGISPYYDWLLDMEHFDNSLFKVMWVTQYKYSSHYLLMLSIPHVKVAVKKYLKPEEQSELAQVYAIYCK